MWNNTYLSMLCLARSLLGSLSRSLGSYQIRRHLSRSIDKVARQKQPSPSDGLPSASSSDSHSGLYWLELQEVTCDLYQLQIQIYA
ncbi:hypothetical protein F4679DRAFT_523484 [Xylaria curta]|nr:hypothetical protein F4679DRAFT_523484 [Xylaria curta]